MLRSTRSTTRLRFITGLGFAFAFPGFWLGQAFYWLDKPYGRQDLDPVSFGVVAIVFGVFLGWPFVLGAVGAWALLDQFDLHAAPSAALVGMATGTLVAFFAFRDGRFQGYPIAYPLCMALGVATALGVWWIAYGRQSRLPAPRVQSKPTPLAL